MATLIANAPADPATLFSEEVQDLYEEAKNWLDGKDIENEEQASAVSSLLNRLRRVSNDADDARKAEKKPHDDAAKAVQTKWKPILDKADLAANTAKQALTPWLAKVAAKQTREAGLARQEAERIAQAAREAHQGASGNLTAAEDAERLLKAAAGAEKYAAKVEKAKPLATGGERAIGLVDKFTAEVTEPLAFGKWAWEHCRGEYTDFLQSLAERECRSGNRQMPGVTIHHEKVAR